MRRLFKMVLLGISLVIVVWFVFAMVTTSSFSTFGSSPDNSRLDRIKNSPNYDGEKFVNPVATVVMPDSGSYTDGLKKWFGGDEIRVPAGEIPIVELDGSSFSTENSEELKVTWLGHSTALIEIDGRRILTDPVWAERTSPSSLIGPSRFHPVPIAIEDLPALDAVIVSHDHYDHLDRNAVMALAKTGVTFLVPLGVGAHLEGWDIDPSQIVELDWWDTWETANGDLQIVATPGRHFSGRGLFVGSNKTLWATWAIVGPSHRVFFCGDTGPFPGFADIGEKYGPFDLTLMKIGAFSEDWPDIHLTPEQAVEMHLALKGRVMLPIHWGTFNLAYHSWFEPSERVAVAAEACNVTLVIPRPGQTISPSDPVPLDYWWREAM